jgi:hypothetical protein
MAQENKRRSTYTSPPQSNDGRLGYLTNDQVEKLQQFWIKLYEIFDGRTPFDQSAPSSYKGQPLDDNNEDGMSPEGSIINSMNGGHGDVATSPTSPKSPKASFSSGWLSNSSSSVSSNSNSNGDSKYNRRSRVTPRFTGSQLHRTFWKLAMMEHPDMIVLKVGSCVLVHLGKRCGGKVSFRSVL